MAKQGSIRKTTSQAKQAKQTKPGQRSFALSVVSGDIAQAKADVLVVNLFEGVTTPAGGTGAVDKALGGLIRNELKLNADFSGKLGQTLVLQTHGKLAARHVVVTGLGKQVDCDASALRRASAAAIRACQKLKAKTVASILHGAGIGGHGVQDAARLFAEGTCLGTYRFASRKSDTSKLDPQPQSVTLYEADKTKLPAIKKGLALGEIIATHVCLVRDWVNDSANHVTPTFLKNQAQATAGLTCRVLGMPEIKKLKMGLIEAVSRGSDEPPYVIHMAYKPKAAKTRGKTRKITLVGKGLTFDSGGLSLKPAKSMEQMKMDMAGSAVVIAVLKAIAALSAAGYPLDVEVHGFVGTCENMPSGRACRPGDIVASMSGKTVEINNTDAEGRLVLADVLTYAQRQTDPDELIDLATLTGACIVALGTVACGVMGTSQPLIDALMKAAKPAGEKVWQLPLYDEYRRALDSEVADLINANAQGEAGSQNGGMFLKEFVDEGRAWAHLDIAGPAMVSRECPETPKGATGFAVRTLLYYLYDLK